MMRRVLTLLFIVTAVAAPAFAAERFPPPDFSPGYRLPGTTTPAARAEPFNYLDIGVIAAALILASYLVLHRR